ncbi:multidrug effflux MFS transporter [Glycomyces xiaoerkulensis]|uniref:multidrug effflux MFS transporter n=1 Tax=Glycomyces xiaoerkulensis TaxID=2038139 RepID=UPI0018E3FC94|nr:multidrug effflux MFS transporter [Glycomyces xiaoerkulensis]
MSAAAFNPEAANGAHSRRYIVMMVFVLGALTATAPLATDLYLPAFPDMAEALGSTENHIQLTLTSMMVGLAAGQAVLGPLSDRFGRRVPLLAGMGVFTVTALLCAVATSAEQLIAIRFAQGLSGAAGMVIARAVIRDHFKGDDMTRFTAKMLFITMLAPMLGPLIGAQLIHIGPWPVIFVFMGVMAALATGLVWRFLPESLPADQRQEFNGREFVLTLGRLVRDPRFIAPTLVVIFNFSMLFTYVSTFSFVSQNEMGASPGVYSLLFAAGTVAILADNQTNMFMIKRVESTRRMLVGLTVSMSGVAWIAGVQLAGIDGLVTVPIGIAVMMFGCGIIFPNAGAAAMSSQRPQIAGTASAFMGCLQMAAGGAMPALATLGGVSLLSMTGGMVVYGLGTAIAVLATVRIYRAQPVAASA